MKRDKQMINAELLQEVDTLRRCVSELEQTRKVLCESEEKWRSLLKETPDIVIVVDRQGTIRFINHTVPGITEQESLGKNIYDYISPDYHKVMRKDLKQVFTTGQIAVHEICGAGAYGRLARYQAHLAPIKQEGRIIAASIVTRDITEQKKAEDALRESEERYKALFQGTAEGIIVADIKTLKYKFVNPAICRMLGYTEEEMMRFSVPDVHRKEEIEYAISEFKAQARGEKKLSTNMPFLRKDGKIIYADIQTSKVLIDGTKCNVGFFTDVTERKKAEDALRENEVKYRTLLENLPQKIFLKDKKSVYLSCNENFARDLKIKPEEIPGKTDFDFFPRKLAEKYRLDDKQIIESGVTKEIDETYVEDGQEEIVHTVKTPVKDSHGKAIGVLGIFWDVTEQRRLEQILRESEEKYRTLVESAGESIAMFDNKGRLLFINKKGEKQLGGNSENLVGKTMCDIFPKKIADRQARAVRKVIRTGKELTGIFLTELQGRPCWYNTTIVPLRKTGGKSAAAMVIARDITEQKQKSAYFVTKWLIPNGLSRLEPYPPLWPMS